jgi:hypothetical protein
MTAAQSSAAPSAHRPIDRVGDVLMVATVIDQFFDGRARYRSSLRFGNRPISPSLVPIA